MAIRLAGSLTQPLAMWEGENTPDFRQVEAAYEHLGQSAGGIALLSQLSDDAVRAALHGMGPRRPGDLRPPPHKVWEIVEAARGGAPVVERGWTLPSLGCVALAWPVSHVTGPTAVVVLAPVEVIDERLDEIVDALQAARPA